MDWGAGEYELTAQELQPAADHLVAVAEVGPGDRVLDLGCGTGNVASSAAQAGATVTGVDPSERLLGVARERVGDGNFVLGRAEELPFEDGAFDKVISAFAVIFAEDPPKAMAEIVRVLAPGGVALISAWTTSGAMFECIGELSRAVAALTPDRPPPPRFQWAEPDVVRSIVEPTGATVSVEPADLSGVAPSPEAVLERFESVHPGGMAMSAALTAAGAYEEPRARALQRLAEGGDPQEDGFHFVSSYLIYRITK